MAHVGLYCWMSISIAWSSGCAFGMTFNKAHSSGVTCITNYWENAMNLPIFQVPSCSAFSSSKMRLSIFSSMALDSGPNLPWASKFLACPGVAARVRWLCHGWILWSPFIAWP